MQTDSLNYNGFHSMNRRLDERLNPRPFGCVIEHHSVATMKPPDPSEENEVAQIISRFTYTISLPSDYVTHQGQIP